MLLIFKPFQVGDYIIIAQQNGCEGTVYKIEICYTTLISIDNKNIVIPNGTLSGSIITNVTARDLRKLEIKVGISYDSDIKKAKAILELGYCAVFSYFAQYFFWNKNTFIIFIKNNVSIYILAKKNSPQSHAL